MDCEVIVDRLSRLGEGQEGQSPDDMTEFIRVSASETASKIQQSNGSFKIVDLIKGINAILTNGSYEIRCRGVELLGQVLRLLPTRWLSEKEIELMTEFICLRLIDHKSMERPALECLSYFVDCDHKPARYNKQLLEFIKSKVNVHKMEPRIRGRIYELLKKFVAEKKRLSNTINGEFLYSLVTILEGENNPDNLMLCFGMISFILKNFDELDPFIDDIFEWLQSYYPIDYTPSDIKDAEKEGGEQINIQRLDLVEALYECFYANPLNSDNLQTLLLEKVDSNVMSSKLESLECLIKCYEQQSFPLASITKYNSTLWTALRMACLRKIDTVDPKLLETSLRTLTALARRLSADKDSYFTFISDMYEELAIAFRKPEMDLFDAAARLVTHASMPSLIGFNYVVEKILNIVLNALEANELKPLAGLVYIFEQLHLEHPDGKLQDDLNEKITKLTLKVIDLLGSIQNPDSCRLLEALFEHQIQFKGDNTLDQIASKLWAAHTNTLPSTKLSASVCSDIGKCIALLCVKYNKFDLITETKLELCDLNTLIRLMYDFDLKQIDFNQLQVSQDGQVKCPNELVKFSIYLRLLTLELHDSSRAYVDALDQLIVNDCLIRLREQLLVVLEANNDELVCHHTVIKICQQSAVIHAILLNKLAPNNVNQILMKFFSSNYCQNLVSCLTEAKKHDLNSNCGARLTLSAYLPHVKWIFKSLVVRNHQLASPLINLVLNCIVSDKAHPNVAREASLVFSFVLQNNSKESSERAEEKLFCAKKHYQIFSLYKQKLYTQTIKEVKLRYDQLLSRAGPQSTKNNLNENEPTTTATTTTRVASLLIFAIASQLTHLPLAVYKRDHEWLVRQMLKLLSEPKTETTNADSSKQTGRNLSQDLYPCLENLIQKDLCDGLVPFLPSLIDMNLRNAQASTMTIRHRALVCLVKIANTFKESDLLVYRSNVIERLRSCLTDKKRLVRQVAGEARLKWVMIGQPIGS